MARNGSGVYTNPYPNFVAGTVISSTEVDANNAAMGTALTGSIAADGQTTITGNLPMATNKFTGLGAGSASTDSANLGQVQAGQWAALLTRGLYLQRQQSPLMLPGKGSHGRPALTQTLAL